MWGSVIKERYEESDNWMTKEVTTPYCVSLWKSIRELWNEFKQKTKIKVVDQQMTLKLDSGRTIDMQKEIWRLSSLTSKIQFFSNKVLQLTYALFKGGILYVEDTSMTEIPGVTNFFKSIDQFSGLETGLDRLQWSGSRKGIFKLGATYKKLNHQNLQLLRWHWRHIWKAKIAYKVSCFVWLLAKETDTGEFNEEAKYTLLQMFFLWKNFKNSQSLVHLM